MTYLCFLLIFGCCAESAKILAFFMFPSISHQNVFQPLWRELSLRGHDVTVITPNPLRDPNLSNLTEIDVSSAYDVLAKKDFSRNMGKNKLTISKVSFMQDMLLEVTEAEIRKKEVQELLRYDDDHFDLLLVQAMHPLVYFFGAKFKAPIVGVSSFSLFLNFHDAVGNPTHPLISPDIIFSFDGTLSFWEKVKSCLFNIWFRVIYYWYTLPKADRAARNYLGNDVPHLGDVIRNTSIFLVNANCISQNAAASVPNMIMINQMHIKKKKPLPKHLQDYLDSSPQGVIYFSLGSNVKSANLTIKTRKKIIQALAELPYKVLWKWETDYLPGCPDNVLTRKWLPQQDILGHPNVKVFVTQGGLQSLEEAITSETPMVGLPFMADQVFNINKMVSLGMGLGLDHATMTKDALRDAILAVARDHKYKKRVEESKDILVDQPIKGVEKAVWWIEYVLRHKGAKHLRSQAADLSFIEYFLIDVIAFLLLGFVLFVLCAKIFLNLLLSRFKRLKIKVN